MLPHSDTGFIQLPSSGSHTLMQMRSNMTKIRDDVSLMYVASAGPLAGQGQYGNPLFQGTMPASPSPMFPGFRTNPVWSPAVNAQPTFHTPHAAARPDPVLPVDTGDMWVEEHFATILESSLNRRGDVVGLLMGLAGALESRANDLRYNNRKQAASESCLTMCQKMGLKFLCFQVSTSLATILQNVKSQR